MKKGVILLVVGVLSSLIGLEIVMGWILKSPFMVQVIPGSRAIGLNTALFLILIGLYYIFESLGENYSKFNTAISAVVGVSSLLVLIENIFNLGSGIDWTGLYKTIEKSDASTAGRTPKNVCLSFLLISAYLFFKDKMSNQWGFKGAKWVASAVLIMSLFGFVGYVLQIEALYEWYRSYSVEFPTVLMLILISVVLWMKWGYIPKISEYYKEEDQLTPLGIFLLAMVGVVAIAAYSPIGQSGLDLTNVDVHERLKQRFQMAVCVLFVLIVVGGVVLRWCSKALVLRISKSEKKSAEAAQKLYHVEEQLRTITDNLPALIAYITKDECYEFVNKTFGYWYNMPKNKIIGKTVQQIIGDDVYSNVKPYINQVLSGEAVTFEQEFNLPHLPRFTQTTYTPGFRGTKVDGFYVMINDISDRKLHEEHITHLAHHDNLTGLANRTLFHDRLNRSMMRSQRSHNMMALLYMDVDKFKSINDTLGHAIGDILLKQFAERLLKSVRATDTVARLGGDEFTVIMESVGNEGNVEAILNKILFEIRRPFNLEGTMHDITSSIGVAFYTSADMMSADELIRRADGALYKAKRAGRNRYELADKEP